MEKIVKDSLMKHLTTLGLISSQQHGFFNKKACVTNFLESIDQIASNIAKKRLFGHGFTRFF